jgi:hypothetical protein
MTRLEGKNRLKIKPNAQEGNLQTGKPAMLQLKIATIGLRLLRAIQYLPDRVWRMGLHIYAGTVFFGKPHRWRLRSVPWWWLEFLFYTLDVLAVPELYESLADFFKWNTRKLTPQEEKLARSVFADAIDLRRVRVDEQARVACKSHHLLYVSFHTINAWGRFRPDIFIHELVHVWQFERMGAVYIPRALAAQFEPAGYDYGGVHVLKNCLLKGGSLLDFNPEQQADIISDYFRIREGLVPCWGVGTEADLPVYEHFLREITGRT